MGGGEQKIKIEASRSKLSGIIDEWVLNETDRAMLRRNLIDGRTIEAIAEEFNYSPRQTQRRLSRGKAKIMMALNGPNVVIVNANQTCQNYEGEK